MMAHPYAAGSARFDRAGLGLPGVLLPIVIQQPEPATPPADSAPTSEARAAEAVSDAESG
jgi:hypothetical protein